MLIILLLLLLMMLLLLLLRATLPPPLPPKAAASGVSAVVGVNGTGVVIERDGEEMFDGDGVTGPMLDAERDSKELDGSSGKALLLLPSVGRCCDSTVTAVVLRPLPPRESDKS